MVTSRSYGVRIAGIACAIPEKFLTWEHDAQFFGETEMKKISDSTGVKKRHIATGGMCTSDLCFAATEQLLKDLDWSRNSIDALIFITQTPDYKVPATACTLQHRLGFSKQCAAFDVNLGCSGHSYGLWMASSLINSGGARRILLLVGDVSSGGGGSRDRSSGTLFGDAGSATALERDENATPITFSMGTDGSGRDHLIIPAGACRHPHTPQTAEARVRKDGNIRRDEDVFMDGAEIFTFSLREVPPLVREVLDAAGWTMEDVDAFVLHQANAFILKNLTRKLKIKPPEKMIFALEDYGNTSSASIPLAMTHALADKLRTGSLNLLLSGFGVGLSWGAVAVTCGPMVMSDLLYVDESIVLNDGWCTGDD